MRDRVWIFAGLALFVAALTSPAWYALANAKSSSQPPKLQMPANQKECVAPAGTMLIQWREDVVRHGDRRFVAFNGKVYEKSLTGTCLGCHNKQQFCDRCHAYSGVSTPSCWNCHSDPQTVARSITRSTP
jgi:hypothetical protein